MAIKSVQNLLKDAATYPSSRLVQLGNRTHRLVPASGAPSAEVLRDYFGCTLEYATKMRANLSGIYVSRDGTMLCSATSGPSTISDTKRARTVPMARPLVTQPDIDSAEVALRAGKYGAMRGGSFSDALLAIHTYDPGSVSHLGLDQGHWSAGEGGYLKWQDSASIPNLGDVIFIIINQFVGTSSNTVSRIFVMDATKGPWVIFDGQVLHRGVYNLVTSPSGNNARTSFHYGLIHLPQAPLNLTRTPNFGGGAWPASIMDAIFSKLGQLDFYEGSSAVAVFGGKIVPQDPGYLYWGWPGHMGLARTPGKTLVTLSGSKLKEGLALLHTDNGVAVPREVIDAELPGVYTVAFLDNPVNPPADFLVGTPLEEHRNDREVLDQVAFPDSSEKHTIRQVKARIAKLSPRSIFYTGTGRLSTAELVTAVVVDGELIWKLNEVMLDVDSETSAFLAASEVREGAVVLVSQVLNAISTAYLGGTMTAAQQTVAMQQLDDVDSTAPPISAGFGDDPYTGSGMDWARTYGTKDAADQVPALTSAIYALTGVGIS